MSHSTVMVVIKGAKSAAEAEGQLETLLEPFNENADVNPYFSESSTEFAVRYYKENPDLCSLEDESAPVMPYDEYMKSNAGTVEEMEIEWTRQALGAYERDDRNAGIYQDGKFGTMSTYNPDSKWDWWTLGGRWHGFFQLKPKVKVGGEPVPEWRQAMGVVGKEEGRTDGVTKVDVFDGTHDAILGMGGVFGDPDNENFEGRADLARKGDIDFEAMRAIAAQKADLEYDQFEAATRDIPVATPWQEVMRKTFFDHDMDPDDRPDFTTATKEERDAWQEEHQRILNEARATYHAQPWVKALQEASLLGFMGDPIEDWCVHTGGRAAYVSRAYNTAVQTFAVLMDGQWHQKGSMGWWGMVSDEKDPNLWSQECRKLLDSLDDDVYLAVVDVHI